MSPTRAEVRAFGKKVKRGDRFVNRYAEHGTPPHVRMIEVVQDVRSAALFIIRVVENEGRPQQIGKVSPMRARTLMLKYDPMPAAAQRMRTGEQQ